MSSDKCRPLILFRSHCVKPSLWRYYKFHDNYEQNLHMSQQYRVSYYMYFNTYKNWSDAYCDIEQLSHHDVKLKCGPVVQHCMSTFSKHDDVIKWQHFPRYWPFVRGIHRSPVNSPHKGQWHGALLFSLICAWTNSWTNNGDAGEFRRHCAHYDISVMNPKYAHYMTHSSPVRATYRDP